MSIDMLYNTEPSNQLALNLEGDKGAQDVADARAWIAENPEVWGFMVDKAKGYAEHYGYVSMRALVNLARFEFFVSIRNALTPAMARIMEQEHPQLKGAFHKSKSNADGHV